MAVACKAGVPAQFSLRAFGQAVPVAVHRLWNIKRRVHPADSGAGEGDFFGAQWFAVGFAGVLAVGAAFAYAGFADDQRGFVGAVFSVGNGAVYGVYIVAVDFFYHVPAVGFKALRSVVDKPRRYLAVNADTVVVVQRDQFV